MVTLQQVNKQYGAFSVLKDITAQFLPGQIHGIVGQNGSGKSVLLKLISGLVKPSSGQISVNGQTLGKDVDFPDRIGLLIERPGFIPTLSAKKNLQLLAAYRGLASKEDIKAVIRLVGLDPEDKKPVGKYSLGMKQRLGIAQAIMEKPKLVLLDEPFSGLDKTGVKEMYDLFKQTDLKDTLVLLTSHNPQDIEALCAHVYELDAGVLSQLS